MESKNYLQIWHYNDKNSPEVMNTANYRNVFVYTICHKID